MGKMDVQLRLDGSPEVIAGLVVDNEENDITAAVLIKLHDDDEEWTLIPEIVLHRFATGILRALGEKYMIDKTNRLFKSMGVAKHERYAMLQMLGNSNPDESAAREEGGDQ